MATRAYYLEKFVGTELVPSGTYDKSAFSDRSGTHSAAIGTGTDTFCISILPF